MAITANKADSQALPTDPNYCTYTRSGAGTPNGSVVPDFAGEIYWDTTNKVRWKAVNKLNSGWRPMEAEVT